MSKLEFISDENLKTAIEFLLDKANASLNLAEKNFNKNVIDPFAAIFEISGFNLTDEGWITNEKTRQAQKTLLNHVGEFHQKILGHVEGWENLGTGSVFDILCKERKILAEIKNKHNTVSGGKLKNLYDDLEGLVMPKNSSYKGYIAYYVQIIPKKPQRFDTPFAPAHNNNGTKKQATDLIRTIDGYSFYNLVTGVEDALQKLYNVMPEVIYEIDKPYTRKLLDLNFLNHYFNSAYCTKKKPLSPADAKKIHK